MQLVGQGSNPLFVLDHFQQYHFPKNNFKEVTEHQT